MLKLHTYFYASTFSPTTLIINYNVENVVLELKYDFIYDVT